MKKIVTIGGGTGQYTLLKGLKNYDIDLTAIVNIVDSGGSSGRLRMDFGVLPPGDIRNCLIALSDDAKMKELADLFAYRFKSSSDNGLNHNLGNLILTALSSKYGDMGQATKIAGDLLNIKGKVLPVSIDPSHLIAETESGKVIEGEESITCLNKEEKIKKIWLKPEAFAYKDAANEIRNADLIVICSGEIHGSIIPNFLVKGINEAIKESKGKLVYVCNLVTKQGSYGFKASDFVNEIQRYLERKIDYVICNIKKPAQKVVDKYKAEESFFVEPDLDGETILKEDLLIEKESDEKIIARHNPEKVAKLILGILEK
ncbi:MAG: YvcK family protein [Nanoarchaeota archaeon]|nr:YvcK family protein [Nanoarchaeota archaeon]